MQPRLLKIKVFFLIFRPTSTYLIVDSCTVAVYISHAHSSLDRNSCGGWVPFGFS